MHNSHHFSNFMNLAAIKTCQWSYDCIITFFKQTLYRKRENIRCFSCSLQDYSLAFQPQRNFQLSTYMSICYVCTQLLSKLTTLVVITTTQLFQTQPVQNQSLTSCIFLSPYFSARQYSHGIIVLFYLHHHHSHIKPAHKQFSSSKSQFYLYSKKTLLSLLNKNHHNPIVSFLLIPISFFLYRCHVFA